MNRRDLLVKTGAAAFGPDPSTFVSFRGRTRAVNPSTRSSAICLLMNISISVNCSPCSGVTKAMAMNRTAMLTSDETSDPASALSMKRRSSCGFRSCSPMVTRISTPSSRARRHSGPT